MLTLLTLASQNFKRVAFTSLMLALTLLSGCSDSPWNNPYPASESDQNILYSSFEERPKHLDPVQSYSSNEYAIHGQIYEPVLQYHYLKRPYALEPLTAVKMPEAVYLDAADNPLPDNADEKQIAYTQYTIQIKPGIHYQPHPAFAKNDAGEYRYHNLQEADLQHVRRLADFSHTGSRELTAADYVYQIKRLAHPKLHSPIRSLMNKYIVGLADFAKKLDEAYKEKLKTNSEPFYLDLTQYDLAGVELVDRYTYRIKVKGKYPQLLYWLAMPFFSPIPAEVDRFYTQAGMKERNISLDWYPVGTGAYMLIENNPNRQMILQRNPNYHDDVYPSEGEEGDAERGLLADAGKKLPFIDKVVYSLEKENIPYWNKFLQGYYDISGISSDSFDQAIQFNVQGDAELTPVIKDKNIKLITAVQASTYYLGFNMLDELVGGYSPAQQKLRQAISIAIDYEEYISIFANGRGITAHSPLPPGIFGFQEGKAGINPFVFNWVDGQAQRKSIEDAKRLLAEAGYPDGRDIKTGKPLIIHLDITATGPESKALLDWLRKQFAKIDLQLIIRDTDYNRFQEKMRKGNAQLFMWGWNADYPDPENFFFLLYGPNGKAKHGGENAANYDNAEFNSLFDRMKNMPNSAQRLQLIERMQFIIQRDAPWLWGWHPKSFSLHHAWYFNSKPNLMAHNTMKYRRIDPDMRQQLRTKWNQPIVWPIFLFLFILIISLIPAIRAYKHKVHASALKRKM